MSHPRGRNRFGPAAERNRRAWWLAAVLAFAALGWFAAPTLMVMAGLRQAIWLEIRATGEALPDLRATVESDGNALAQPLLWDPAGSADFVFVAPRDGDDLELVGVTADGSALSMRDIKGDARWQRTESGTLSIGRSGALRLPAAPRQLTLHFASSGRTLTTIWRGETLETTLGTGSTAIEFATRDQRSAWLMLPPQPISAIRLDAAGDQTAVVREIVLHAETPSTWTAAQLGTSAPAECGASGAAISLSRACTIALPLPDGLNQAPIYMRPAIAAGFALFGCLALLVLQAAARILAPADPAGIEAAGTNGRNILVARIILIAGLAAACVFHFGFWHGLPVLYSPDSLDYYAPGRAIADGYGLRAVPSFRTPGYPLMIAAVLAVAGDGFSAIGAMQYLVMLAAGIVIYFALRTRLGPVGAAIIGVATAFSPLSTVNANVIWTDCTFASVTAAAIAVLTPRLDGGDTYRKTARTILGALLLGAAIMIRPHAQVVALIDIAAIAVWLWLRRSRPAALTQAAAHAGLLIGILAGIYAPWLHEMHRREGFFVLNTMHGIADAPPRDQVLAPAPVGISAAYILYLYQDRLGAELPANAPFAAYVAGYHYANGHVFRTSLNTGMLYDSRYPTEVVLESVRRDIPGTIRFWTDIFRSNTTFRVEFPGVLRFADTSSFLKEMSRPAPLPLLPLSDRGAAEAGMAGWADMPAEQQYSRIDSLMRVLQSEAREARPTAIGMAAARLPDFVIERWRAITMLGLGAVIVIVVAPRARPLLTVWIYVVSYLAMHSLFGTANDRYMAALEPLLYMLIVAVALALFELVRDLSPQQARRQRKL